MLKHLLCLLAASLGFFSRAQAQAYEPGLLVLSNGDTLRGQIENNQWEEPPKFVRFRTGPASPSEIYKPRQLRSFLLTGGRCFRYKALPIDHAAESRLDFLPKGYHPNIKVDTLLAEVLLDGPASVLRVYMFSATHYLVQRPGQPVLDLSERRYLRQIANGSWAVTEGNNYRALLEAYFGDCPSAVSATQTAPFTANALVDIVQIFNRTCDAAHQSGRSWLPLKRVRTPMAFEGGVLAGGVYALFDPDTTPSTLQLHPFGGLYGEIYLPGHNLAVYGELSVSYFHGNGTAFAYNIQTPIVVNGVNSYYDTPVYSSYNYHAWLAITRIGARYFTPLPREQQLYFEVGMGLQSALFPVVTTTSGPPATPPTGFATLPAPYLGAGWQGPRWGVNVGGQLIGARLSASYRLGRNPSKAR